VQHKRFLARLVGIDKLIGEPQLRAQIKAGVFLGEKGIGTSFGDEIADPMRDDLSAPRRIGFEHCTLDGKALRRGLFLHGKGGGQTGNTTADNDDCTRPAHD